jgi:2-hydroxychromene-2-carboxylate isomerase
VQLTFSFDPNCPWTWLTSRWLVKVAALDGHTITWGSLSLPHVNAGNDVPEEWRDFMEAGRQAHRIIETLVQAGEQEAVGAFYQAYGIRKHRNEEDASPALVRLAAEDAGLPDAVVAAAEDESLDAAVGKRTDAIVDAAGGDVGSPVLGFGPGQVFFGPIIDEVPGDDAAVRLFRSLRVATAEPFFFEIKRGRHRGPQALSS